MYCRGKVVCWVHCRMLSKLPNFQFSEHKKIRTAWTCIMDISSILYMKCHTAILEGTTDSRRLLFDEFCVIRQNISKQTPSELKISGRSWKHFRFFNILWSFFKLLFFSLNFPVVIILWWTNSFEKPVILSCSKFFQLHSKIERQSQNQVQSRLKIF